VSSDILFDLSPSLILIRPPFFFPIGRWPGFPFLAARRFLFGLAFGLLASGLALGGPRLGGAAGAGLGGAAGAGLGGAAGAGLGGAAGAGLGGAAGAGGGKEAGGGGAPPGGGGADFLSPSSATLSVAGGAGAL